MNYLAHALLAGGSGDRMVGSVLADSLRRTARGDLTAGIQDGVALHRFVDAFTDHHPVVLELRTVLHPYCRAYAGPVVDIVFDHYLSRHWGVFTTLARTAFIEDVYDALARTTASLPTRATLTALAMVHGDWLTSYGTWVGVVGALNRLAGRCRRPLDVPSVADAILGHDEDMACGFLAFFADASAAVRSRDWGCGQNPSETHAVVLTDGRAGFKPAPTDAGRFVSAPGTG